VLEDVGEVPRVKLMSIGEHGLRGEGRGERRSGFARLYFTPYLAR
jgi:hypothetical protein